MNIAADPDSGTAPAPTCADTPKSRGRQVPAAANGNRLAESAALAIMLALAIGAAAVVCGVYSAFDDASFGIGGSTLSRILALAGF